MSGGDSKSRVLFICGSIHQTKQMLAIASQLPDVDAWFTPYYVDGVMEWCRRRGLIDMTIAGGPWSKLCLEHLQKHGASIDYQGARGGYDLVLTAQDAFVPKNATRSKLLLVQEGMTDPEDFMYRVIKRFPFVPRWLCSTAAFGLSDAYDRFCVGSEGYRDFFARKGVRPEKMVVTGIPNFDDCEKYRANDFPHRDYVLVCTSDARETFKLDDRKKFLREARRIAAGRPMIFKLHPNEKWERATREIRAIAPDALVYTTGSAEEMVANCSVLVVEYSTLSYVALALGKEVHSHFDVDVLRRLLPWQNGGRAAANVARECRQLLGVAS